MSTLPIKDLPRNEEMDSGDMAATEGGRMMPVSATHNLFTYANGPNPPSSGPGLGFPGISGELLDDTDPNLNPAGV